MKIGASKNETRKNGMEELPDDIIYNILLRLPAKFLIRCKGVCMGWCNTVESPRFVEDHVTQSTQNQLLDNILVLSETFNPNDFEMNISSLDFNCDIRSGASVVTTTIRDMDFLHDPTSFSKRLQVSKPCNGLLCFTDKCNSSSVWNLATREYLALPKETKDVHFITYDGLGLDEVTGVYKFVRLKVNYLMRSYEVRRLTMGKDSWRSKGWFKDLVYVADGDMSPIIFAGEALNWLSKSEDGKKKLMSLNVGNEVFSYVPQLPNSEGAEDIRLREWMGCISLWCVGDLQTHIWVMKDYRFFTKQCTMEYESKIGRYLVPLGVFNNGEILLRYSHEFLKAIHIASYNIKTKNITRYVQVQDFSFQIAPTLTLVSIKAATWNGITS